MSVDKVDLLVVNHNTKDKLKRLLDELHKDDNGSWTLSISDNGSTDGSVDWLAKNAHKYRIEHLYKNANIGYARAVNMMAEDTDSKYLAALNGDVWMCSADAQAMVEFMNENEDVAIAGPKQRNEKNQITHGGIGGTHKQPRHLFWNAMDHEDALARNVRECVTVSGSAYFVRRSVWNALSSCPLYHEVHEDLLGEPVEGAMPALQHFYEETTVSYHLAAHPELGKVVYNGNVSIGHSWHSSSPIGSAYANRGFKEGQKFFRAFCDEHGIEHD